MAHQITRAMIQSYNLQNSKKTMIEERTLFQSQTKAFRPMISRGCLARKQPFQLSRKAGGKFPVFEKSGSWTQNQKVRYALFVESFFQVLMRNEHPARKGIFQHMAEFVRTRNLNQCRSFHQNLMIEHGSLAGYLGNFRKMTPKFAESFSLERTQLQSLKEVLFGSTDCKREFSAVSARFAEESMARSMLQAADGFSKEKNDDNIPTDLVYRDEIEVPAKQTSLIFLQKIQNFVVEEKAEEGLGFATPVQISEGEWVNPYILMKQSTASQQPKMSQTYFPQQKEVEEKDWVECHQYFTTWMNKLESIFGKPDTKPSQ